MAHMNARQLAEELVSLLMGDRRHDRTVSIDGIRGYGLGVEIIAISVDEAETIAERFVESLIERFGIKDPDEQS